MAKEGVFSRYPGLTALSTAAICSAGSKQLNSEILPKINAGDVKICFNATEKETGFNIFELHSFARK